VSVIECLREPELADAIVSGLWPDRCDEDLHDHAETCEICRDLLAVLNPLRQEHVEACRQASVPSARVVWWRAHVRARADAAQTVTQPIAWLNGITTVSVIAVAVAVMGAAWRIFEARRLGVNLPWDSVSRLFDFGAPTRSAANGLAAVSTMVWDSTVFVWGVGACVLLAPLALYWILADD
jgi:hypothetical protein